MEKTSPEEENEKKTPERDDSKLIGDDFDDTSITPKKIINE